MKFSVLVNYWKFIFLLLDKFLRQKDELCHVMLEHSSKNALQTWKIAIKIFLTKL